MPTTRRFNLHGMDLRAGYNSDALWYLQDATVIGENAVRQRPEYPAFACANYGHTAAESVSNRALGSWGYNSSDSPRLSVYNTTTKANSSIDRTAYAADGTTMVFETLKAFNEATKLGDEVFFCFGSANLSTDGSFVARWGGSKTSIKTSTGTGITVSTTNGSPTLTFSSSVTAQLEVGMYIAINGVYNTWHRIIEIPSATTVTVDTNMNSTLSGKSWAANPWVFLCQNIAVDRLDHSPSYRVTAAPTYITTTMWETTSGGEPTGIAKAYAIAGHQGRLFMSNGNEVVYSGTEDDVDGLFSGAEYSDVDSRFVVAPELGAHIEKMVSYNGDLFFFKDQGICVLRGVVANGDPSRLGGRVDTISTNAECPDKQSVLATPVGILLANRHGLYLVTSEGLTRVGDEVWPRLSAVTGSGGGVVYSSFVLDNKAYIYYKENASTDKAFVVWDFLQDTWQFRTFVELLSPGAAGTVPSPTSGQIYNITFPSEINSGAGYSIAYYGSEGYGATNPTLLSAATTTVSGIDKPKFMAITAPITGASDTPSHVRVRHVWTNAEVTTEDDTNIYIVNNLGTTYGFDAETITSGQAGSYTLTSSDESWKRNPIASDAYGWSKGVAIAQSYDGSGSVQQVYLRGLSIDYDESGVSP